MRKTIHETNNPFSTFALRGGRLRKRGRDVFSYAPFLTGAVSAVALGSVLALSMPAAAQESTPTTTTTATTTIETTGTVVAGGDSVTKNGDVHTVTSAATAPANPDTDVTVSGSISDEITGVSISRIGDGDFSFTNSATIDDVEYGIDITRGGTGDLDIVNNSAITNVLEQGIYATRSGIGRLKITTTGNIWADVLGIDAIHGGEGHLEVTSSSHIAGGIGIRAVHTGTGPRPSSVGRDIRITGESGFRIEGNEEIGIYAKHTGNGNIYIKTENGSSIRTSYDAIVAKHTDKDSASEIIDIFLKGDVTSLNSDAVFVDQDATRGRVTVVTYRSAVSGKRNGIFIDSSATGSLNYAGVGIQQGSSVSGGERGVHIRHTEGGRASVFLAGSIWSRASNAIEMDTSGDKILYLDFGFSLGQTDANGNKTGGKVVARGGEEATLSLGSASGRDVAAIGVGALDNRESYPLPIRDQVLVLDFSKEEFEGFGTFLKVDIDPWEVRGVTDSANEVFSKASVDEGTLHFRNATFRMSGSRPFRISQGSVLEVHGSNILAGHLRNAGTIAFTSAGANDTLEVEKNYRGSGNLVFHIGNSSWDNDKLTIKGSTRARGAGWDVLIEKPTVILPAFATSTIPSALIEVEGNADADDFESEEITIGARKYDLVHATVNGDHTWTFQDIGPADNPREYSSAPRIFSRVSRREPIVSSEPGNGGSSGTELGFLAGTRENAGGVWARLQNSRTSLRPNAITDSSLRMEDDRVYFGYDTPAMDFMGGDMVVGGSVWQGLATSDVSSPIGGGDIDVESHASALTASWRSLGGFHVGGDVQYTRFSTDMSAEVSAERVSLVRDNEGTGVSASVETEYRFTIPFGAMDFSVAPQMQLVWSSVDFDDFVGPHGALVSLEDGDLTTGRLGLSWNGEWQDTKGSGRIYGGMNLNDALDGRTSVNVSGFSFASKEGFSVDGKLGLSYEWDDGYSVYGEATALRQGDAEEFSTNLGMRIDF